MTIVARKIEEIPISEFCQTGSGGTPSRSKAARYFGGSIPWVKSGELRETVITETKESITEEGLRESAAKLLPANTLLVALYGATVGRIGILGIEAATNQAVCYIIPDEGRADRRYLYYALRSKVPVWLSQRVGGGQPNISQRIIKDTKIPLPPLSEQKRIADILDKADAIRRKRQEADLLSDTLPLASYYNLVGDPIVNPKAWPKVRVGSLLETITDYRGKTPPKSQSGIPLISAANVKRGKVVFDKPTFISKEDYEKWTTRGFTEPGDVLITTEAPVGEVAAYPSKGTFLITRRVMALRPREDELRSAFLLHTFLCPSVRTALEQFHHGSTVPRILKPVITNFEIPLPPVELQDQFTRIITGHTKALATSSLIAKDADCLFNSLVQRAFKGEL